jgi:hypothetical protein
MFKILATTGTMLALVSGIAAAKIHSMDYPRVMTVKFSGVAAGPAQRTMGIHQPNGSYVHFGGEVPAFPFARGERVSVSFKSLVTRASDAVIFPSYHGQTAVDGVYRFTVSRPGSQLGNYGPSRSPGALSGGGSVPVAQGSMQEPVQSEMTVVLNADAATYTVEGKGAVVAGAYQGPGFLYDANSGDVISCIGSGCPPFRSAEENAALLDQGNDEDSLQLAVAESGLGVPDGGSFTDDTSGVSGTRTSDQAAGGNGVGNALTGVSATDGAASNLAAGVAGEASSSHAVSPAGLDVDGLALMELGGSQPIKVPEPGMLLLFAAGSGALALRRRRIRAA